MTAVPSIKVIDADGTQRVVGALPDQVAGRTPVEVLGTPLVGRRISATSSSGTAATALTGTCTRISICSSSRNLRFSIGDAPTVTSTTGHYIMATERLEFSVPVNSKIAVILDSSESAPGYLEITELNG